MSKKDEGKCPALVSCTIQNPDDYPGMCEKCIQEYGRPMFIEVSEEVEEKQSTKEGCYIPEICKICDQKGFTRAWGEKLMFLCMWREWSPIHWFDLASGKTCPEFMINGLKVNKK